MPEIVPDAWFATKTMPGLMTATASGSSPTGMVAITVLEEPEITIVVLENNAAT